MSFLNRRDKSHQVKVSNFRKIGQATYTYTNIEIAKKNNYISLKYKAQVE